MTSIWLDESAGERYAPLREDATADVAIVGGGIAGVATAYHLARAGVGTILLEARTIAEAASGRNAGFLLTGVAENFVAACRRYGEKNALRIWRFTKRNQALVRALVRENEIECDLAWNGSDQIAGDDEEWDEIEASAERLGREDVRVRVIGSKRSAIYEDDGELHPVRYVRGLAGAAEAAGATFHERTCVTAIDAGAVRTGRARVSAGAVVVCVNAYASHLLPLRIRPVRGQMLATAPLERRVFTRPAYAHRGYRYWRQREDGRILVGGWRDLAVDVEVGEEERTTEPIQSALETFLRGHAPDAAVTHRWAGIMGFSHDALPYAGRWRQGVFALGGFTGHGLAFATAASALVADLVRGGSPGEADLFATDRP